MRTLRAGWGVIGAVGVLGVGCPDFEQAPTLGGADETGAEDAAVADGQSETGGAQDSASAPATATDGGEPSGVDGSGDDASTGPASGIVCGDEVREGTEECDDGNRIDDDDCSNQCVRATCSDGSRNADETDIDCGGPRCAGCEEDKLCDTSEDCETSLLCDTASAACRIPESCLAIALNDRQAASNIYTIEPLGDGVVLEVVCDMDYDGGGWTRISAEDFADSVDPGWSTTEVDDCGLAYLSVLGGIGNLASGDEVTRETSLLHVPHTELRVRFEWVFIDSWDHEDEGFVRFDDVQVFSFADPTGGGSDLCGEQYDEGSVTYEAVGPSTANVVEILFGSTLNSGGDDESWGLNMTEIYVR